MKHYTYFRSSAAYRVRIALNLKGLAPEPVDIHLIKEGGKQHSPEYRAINPQRRVPSLVLDGGEVLMQSPAIIEYLDEIHPKPAFVLDISSAIDDKMRAVEAYESQFLIGRPLVFPTALDDIRDRARYWGWTIGRAYGEPFASREDIGLASLTALL